MIVGVVDSTVIIHMLRSNPLAIAWANALTTRLNLVSITWLEVMLGAPGKIGQVRGKTVMSMFALTLLTGDDQEWAMEQMERHRLSQGVGINDCLIAAVCYRLNVPIYTDNQKDFLKLLPTHLVIKPY